MALVRADNRWNRRADLRSNYKILRKPSDNRSRRAQADKFHEEAEDRFAPIRFPPQQGYIPGES